MNKEWLNLPECSSAAVKLVEAEQKLKALEAEKEDWRGQMLKWRLKYVAYKLKYAGIEEEVEEMTKLFEKLELDAPVTGKKSCWSIIRPKLASLTRIMSRESVGQEERAGSPMPLEVPMFESACRVKIPKKDSRERVLRVVEPNIIEFYDKELKKKKDSYVYDRDTVVAVCNKESALGFLFFQEKGEKEVIIFLKNDEEKTMLLDILDKIPLE